MKESRKVNAKINSYIDVIERYNAEQFKMFFRMSRETFIALYNELKYDDIFVQKQFGGKEVC